ncbi:hypothetical protein N7457_001526 [Penicillium paradoxum]|uniref:uncharacterized protein n=1 Tax=Penicillium paradoxum TaxID=176176 RepID=UPI0025472CE9|nr:uncharacterized protein N7457_001526 [Penicillium paradoxum]KAJ5794927.1 hypothetical protein N7457_001526 [Penicillium paradoxum]
MASLWYCCSCNFGPHNSSLYDACIQCGTARCPRCLEEKVNDSLNLHSHSCNPISAYAAAVPMDSPRMPALKTTSMPLVVPELPGLGPLPRANCTGISPASLAGTNYVANTYMYICCSCGDGPKIYDHQPQCVICNHMSCRSCEYVK